MLSHLHAVLCLTAIAIVPVVRSQSTDATLSGLGLTCDKSTDVFGNGVGVCQMEPDFSSSTLSYTFSPAKVIQVTPTTNHASATVTVDGEAVLSGQLSQKINPPEGSRKTYNIVVTAQDGITKRTYTFSAGTDFSAKWVSLAFLVIGSLLVRGVLGIGQVRRFTAKAMQKAGWGRSTMEKEVHAQQQATNT